MVQLVSIGQQFSFLGIGLEALFSLDTPRLAVFEGNPTRFPSLAPYLNHHQQFQPQPVQFLRLCFIRLAQFT